MYKNKVIICGVDTSNLPLLKEAQKEALLKKSAAGDKAAREELINGNLRLVLSVIQRFTGRGENLDDLFQVGCIGLIKSIDNFDVTQNVRFSTYAVPVIFGEIKRVYRDSSPVKLGRSLKALSNSVQRVSQELAVKLGREPTIGEIAKEMQLSREEVSEAICAAQSIISLTASGEEGEVQFDIPTESHEEEVCSRLSLSKAISELPEREKELVVMRYFRHKTQNQTAKVLGMTQVQVSRLEKKIMVVIRGKMTG